MYLKKNEALRSSISEIIDVEKCPDLDAKQTLFLKAFWQ